MGKRVEWQKNLDHIKTFIFEIVVFFQNYSIAANSYLGTNFQIIA